MVWVLTRTCPFRFMPRASQHTRCWEHPRSTHHSFRYDMTDPHLHDKHTFRMRSTIISARHVPHTGGAHEIYQHPGEVLAHVAANPKTLWRIVMLYEAGASGEFYTACARLDMTRLGQSICLYLSPASPPTPPPPPPPSPPTHIGAVTHWVTDMRRVYVNLWGTMMH